MLNQIQLLACTRQQAFFDEVLHKLELMPLWHYIQTHNPSYDLPYHNNQHLYSVACMAYELYQDNCFPEPINTEDLRHLITAGLLHDYAHSGGKLVDDENIQIALNAIDNLIHLNLVTTENFSWQLVKALVQATRYPHRAIDVPNNSLWHFLRDADLMYSLEVHALTAYMQGIAEEAVHKLGRVVSPTEFIVLQRKFLAEVTMYSTSGNRIWMQTKQAAENLQDIYAAKF